MPEAPALWEPISAPAPTLRLTLPPPPPDFNGIASQPNNGLNSNYWTILDGYVQTQYDMACYTASNAYAENGNLVIRTRAEKVTCVDGGVNPTNQTREYLYTSGFVDTVGKVAVRNGRVEIRAKLPPPTLRIWPAGWTISTQNQRDKGTLCWPLSTEIDLYEVAGGFFAPGPLGGNAMCSSYHWGTQCFDDLGRYQTGCLSMTALPSSSALPWYSDDFHTYSVEWTDQEITWAINDVVYFSANKGRFPGITLPVPDAQELKLNTAVAWWIDGPPGEFCSEARAA